MVLITGFRWTDIYLSTRNILTVSVGQPFFTDSDGLDGVLGITYYILYACEFLYACECACGFGTDTYTH